MRLLSVLILSTALTGCSWFSEPPSRVESPVVEGINFVGLTVSNAEKTGLLLSQASAMQPIQTEVLQGDNTIDFLAARHTEVTSSLYRGVNAQVLLFQFQTPSALAAEAPILDANGPGIAHLAFQAAKSTQTYDKFLQGGATHIGAKDLVLNPRSHVAYGYVRDYDGSIIEIEHVDVEALELPEPAEHDIRIRQISLATTDMERAVEFYSTLLEIQNPRRMGSLISLRGDLVDEVSGLPGAKIEMAWFQVRNLELEIIQYHEPLTQALSSSRPIDAAGYNMIMFDVTDIETAKKQVLLAGGKLVSEPSSFLGGKTFFARDLDGNLLGFQTLPASSPYSAKQFTSDGLE